MIGHERDWSAQFDEVGVRFRQDLGIIAYRLLTRRARNALCNGQVRVRGDIIWL